jgi:hypothetical protein
MKKVMVMVLAVGLSLGLGFNAMSKSADPSVSWGDDVQQLAKKQPASHKPGSHASCTSCHKVGSGTKPMPANHAGKSPASCKMCHKAG